MSVLRSSLVRAILLMLLLASVPMYVLQYTLLPKTGAFTGFAFEAGGPAYRITRVTPHSEAWNGGMRAGDVFTIPPSQRSMWQYPLPGDRIQLSFTRGAAHRIVEIAAQPKHLSFGIPEVIRATVTFCMWACALLLLARGWRTEYGPAIAVILGSLAINNAFDSVPWVTRHGGGAVLIYAGYCLSLIWIAASWVIVRLCETLLNRKSSFLRFLAIAQPVLFVLMSAGLALIAPWGASLPAYGTTYPVVMAVNEALICTPAFAILYTFLVSRANRNARIAWLFWGFFPYYFGVALFDLDYFGIVLIRDPQTSMIVTRSIELFLPVSLFYGLLSRRTIDLGFVVNRVAVFGAISALVLGVFVLLEYMAGHFAESHGAESWAIQLGIAMAIGITARFLHGRVDRFVDRVFFAKRHADESALRRFAHEAEAFNSADALLDRAAEAVTAHSETTGAAIYLCNDRAAHVARGHDGFPATISIDDAALVALRRWNEPLDTHDVNTALPDGMVFPMSARGKLIGVLACRTKRDATAFAPDEREPLADVARAVARALDSLGAKPADSFDGLGQTVVSLLLSIQDAVTGLREGVR